MENSYKFFCNHECKYFPCHIAPDKDEFNCLFCYCPLYYLGDKCGGNYKFIKIQNRKNDNNRNNGNSGNCGNNVKIIKNCVDCCLPHMPGYYETIVSKLKENSGGIHSRHKE